MALLGMIEKGKRPRDINSLAKWIVERSTGQITDTDELAGKNPAAVKRGKAGGKIGGKARAEKLRPEQRRAIAKKAATARWKKS